MSLVTRVFRIVVPMLAALQLVVFTGAPMYEALTVARQVAASASVTSPDSEPRVPAHDATTCPACQTLRTTAWLPGLPQLEEPIGETTAPATALVDPSPRQLPRQGFLSRAPPHLLG